MNFKQIRLPDSSPAMMGLFGTSIGLQFRVCNYDGPCESPLAFPARQGKESTFMEKKRNWECYHSLSLCFG